jgi:hypothetical protein
MKNRKSLMINIRIFLNRRQTHLGFGAAYADLCSGCLAINRDEHTRAVGNCGRQRLTAVSVLMKCFAQHEFLCSSGFCLGLSLRRSDLNFDPGLRAPNP